MIIKTSRIGYKGKDKVIDITVKSGQIAKYG